MKAFKIIGVILVLVLALAIAGTLYVLNNLNSIVKEAVETVGPKVTQTEVNLNSVDITLTEGRAELGGFRVANPAGFSSDSILKFGKVVLDIDPMSINKDVIVIDEMTIDAVHITAEQKELTTNIQAMLKNLDRGGDSGETTTTSSGKPILLAVNQLNFTDSAIALVTEKHGEYTLKLPKVTASNLGSATNGLTPAELGKAILEPLLHRARDTVRAKLKEEVEERAKDELEEKAGEKLKEALGDDAEQKLKDVKNLFGN